MAKKIEELIVELGIAGLEKVDKLKSSFRDLNKVTNLTDKEITGIRQRLIEFGSQAGNTEKATSGLIKAFEGLIGEARKGSAVWVELNGDLQKFREQSRLTDGQISQLREQIVSFASGANQSQQSIQGYIASLKQLRTEATIGGATFAKLQQDIQQLTQVLRLSEVQATRTNAPIAGLGRGLSGTAAGARRDIEVLDERIKAQRQIINVRTGAAAFNDPFVTEGFLAPGNVSARFGDLPNTTAALNQELSELSERLINTERNTANYLSVAVRMAGVQREASAATQGFAAALRQQLASGQLAPTQKNLQEVIGALRREMIELDQTTAEGSRKYAENASQVNALERQLKELANSYRTVANAATTAATAEQNAANARMRGNYFNRRMMREQEQAFADFANSVNRAVASTPLMLPAAGQTSAPGTGLQVSGGARIGRATGRIQTVLTPGTFPGERTQGPAISPEDADRNRRAYISQIEAERNLREAREASERQLMGYRAEVSKAAQANDGSINSLNRYRESLVTLRNVIPTTEEEFKKLRAQIERVDAQLERTQRTRRRLNAAQATQAAGAVISGGIFGGPEGALGGVIGTAVGGVPGAFAGAAFGAQVGMVRQAIGSY
ncbi:MAG: hypothetical protein ACO3X1_14480, partial [Burkholderiaceae bacterium]